MASASCKSYLCMHDDVICIHPCFFSSGHGIKRGNNDKWKMFHFSERLWWIQLAQRVKQRKQSADDALFIGHSTPASRLRFNLCACVCLRERERFKLILAELGITIKFKQNSVLCSPFELRAIFKMCIS